MDIPAEALWILLTVMVLGVIIGLVVFFAFQGGSFRFLDYILGFFR